MAKGKAPEIEEMNEAEEVLFEISTLLDCQEDCIIDEIKNLMKERDLYKTKSKRYMGRIRKMNTESHYMNPA